MLGEDVGEEEGERVGARDGERVGARDGERVGAREGERVGAREGERVGEKVGESVRIGIPLSLSFFCKRRAVVGNTTESASRANRRQAILILETNNDDCDVVQMG